MAENRNLDPRESLEEILLQKFNLLLSSTERLKAEEIDKLTSLIKEKRVMPENILAVLEDTGELEDG